MSEIKPFTGVDDRVILAEAIPLKTPFTLNIFPTNICNFKCKYCAQSLGHNQLKKNYNISFNNMTIKMIKEISSQAKEFPDPFKLVSFMGHGEPLLNPHLPEMVNIIKESGIAKRIDIITNGSLLTRERGQQLISSGIDVIRISLQGINSKSYKRIAGVDINFDEFLGNLKYLYDNKKQAKIYVKTMDVSLEEDQKEIFYNTFTNISDRMFIDKVKPVYDLVRYDNTACDLSFDRYGERHDKRYICPQPFYMLSIWPDGSVYPCDALYKACSLGNVKSDTLFEMWNSLSLKHFRIKQLKLERFLHYSCKRCCAPDDVIHKEDVLDNFAEILLNKFVL